MNEGFRRLVVVLGLLLAIPWGLGFGLVFCNRALEVWNQNDSRERAFLAALRDWDTQYARIVAVGDSLRKTRAKPISEYSDYELRMARAALQVPPRATRPANVPTPWVLLVPVLLAPIVYMTPRPVVWCVAWVVEGSQRGSSLIYE